jgi:hypothetical protein
VPVRHGFKRDEARRRPAHPGPPGAIFFLNLHARLPVGVLLTFLT